MTHQTKKVKTRILFIFFGEFYSQPIYHTCQTYHSVWSLFIIQFQFLKLSLCLYMRAEAFGLCFNLLMTHVLTMSSDL